MKYFEFNKENNILIGVFGYFLVFNKLTCLNNVTYAGNCLN